MKWPDNIHFVCPFCKRSMSTGAIETNKYIVQHEMPMCAAFSRVDGDTFMTMLTTRAIKNLGFNK